MQLLLLLLLVEVVVAGLLAEARSAVARDRVGTAL